MRSGSFTVLAACGAARRGRLRTARGVVDTPAFMPVATGGAIRGLTGRQTRETGATILLSNAYHLMLEPGDALVRDLGGLHRLMDWPLPLLTDSGGYQVASLSPLRTVTDEGVRFRSHRDGSAHELTPERALEVQRNLGSDIAMVLDECLRLPAPPERVEAAAERSLRWARKSLEAGAGPNQLLFGIVQGGTAENLRLRQAKDLAAGGFDGFGIGGLFMGEPREQTRAITRLVSEALPAERPRYLMGAGLPSDLVASAALGVDLFDSVVPTRLARRGVVFTRDGRVHLRRACYRDDPAPLDPTCPCPACAAYCRGWLRHLVHTGERIAAMLLTAHNLTFYADLTARMRTAIEDGTWPAFLEANRGRWDEGA